MGGEFFMGKRDLLILLLAIAVAAAVAISIFAGSSLETGSWGLSFPQEGTGQGRDPAGDGLHRRDLG